MYTKYEDTGVSVHPSHLWVVDEYCDVIRLKKYKEATAPSYLQKDVPKYRHVFEGESEAAAFIVDRANKGCGKAADALKNARSRAKKCWKKFGPKIAAALQTGQEKAR